MPNWSQIFNELQEALKGARKKFKYRGSTKLHLKIIFINQKGTLFRTDLRSVENVLWKITEKYGHNAIAKFVVESIHGRRVFFCEPSPDLTKLITGDQVTIENFSSLSDVTREVRLKILQSQINYGLAIVENDKIPRRNK